jgi:hypothetical protein
MDGAANRDVILGINVDLILLEQDIQSPTVLDSYFYLVIWRSIELEISDLFRDSLN